MVAWIPVLMSGLLAIAAEPNPPAGPRGPQRGLQDITPFVEQVIEAVDATEEQQTELKAIAEAHNKSAEEVRTKMAALTDEERQELQELRGKVRDARRAGDNDEVTRLQSEIHEIVGTEPAGLLKSTHDKIAAVLTEKQLPAYQALLKSQASNRGGRGARGRGGPGEGQGFMLQRFLDRVTEEVDATEEQQAQFKTIAAEHEAAVKAAREKAAANREANREKMQELREAMRDAAEDGDEEEMASLRTEMRTLVGGADRNEQINATLEKIGKVLTEEQTPKYEALVAELKERMAEAPQGFEGRGPGRGRGGFDGRGPGRGGPRGAQRGGQPPQDDGGDE